MGGIQRQHAMAMQQVLAQPENVATLSRLRLSHYTNARNQAYAALQEKPDDEKLKQAFIQADAQYQAAYKLDPIIQKQVAADQKEQLERDKLEAELEQKNADLKLKQEKLSLEKDKFAFEKTKPQNTSSKDSRIGIQKEFDRFLENNPDYKGKITILDYRKLIKKYEDDPLRAATAIAQRNLSVQINPAKLGDVVNSILKVWAVRDPELEKFVIDDEPGIPELTEEMIKVYTDQGMSREDVIKAYNAKYGE
jgi:hypothetical protein